MPCRSGGRRRSLALGLLESFCKLGKWGSLARWVSEDRCCCTQSCSWYRILVYLLLWPFSNFPFLCLRFEPILGRLGKDKEEFVLIENVTVRSVASAPTVSDSVGSDQGSQLDTNCVHKVHTGKQQNGWEWSLGK